MKSLSAKQKLQYIWDYYKLPLIGICILLYVVSYLIYGKLTQKDIPLYIALINVSMSDTRADELTDGFLTFEGFEPSGSEIELYTDLYLTADVDNEMFAYSYASEMKILGAIDGELLDVVFLNREAFDAFSQNGYLYNLETLLLDADPQLYQSLKDSLVTNQTPGETASEQAAGESTSELFSGENTSDMVSEEKTSQTEEQPVGLDVSDSPYMADADFDGEVYLCVLANTPRTDMVIHYLRYLFSRQ